MKEGKWNELDNAKAIGHLPMQCRILLTPPLRK